MTDERAEATRAAVGSRVRRITVSVAAVSLAGVAVLTGGLAVRAGQQNASTSGGGQGATDGTGGQAPAPQGAWNGGDDGGSTDDGQGGGFGGTQQQGDGFGGTQQQGVQPPSQSNQMPQSGSGAS